MWRGEARCGAGLERGIQWGGKGTELPWESVWGTSMGRGWALVLGKWEGDEKQPSLPTSPCGGTRPGQQARGNLGQDDVCKKVRAEPEAQRGGLEEPGETTGAAGVHVHQDLLPQQVNHG